MIFGAHAHALLLGVELMSHMVCVYSTLIDNADCCCFCITFLILDIRNSDYGEPSILIGTLPNLMPLISRFSLLSWATGGKHEKYLPECTLNWHVM